MAELSFLEGRVILDEPARRDSARGQTGRTRVLCDLFSGACDPEEISRLFETGAEVRTQDGLYAKVWCLNNVVIGGSANASSIGLGPENGLVPAKEVATTSDSGLADSVSQWFLRNWESARPVDRSDIESVRLWSEARRRNGQPPWASTVSEVLLPTQGRTPFRRIRVVVYGGADPDSQPRTPATWARRRTQTVRVPWQDIQRLPMKPRPIGI